MTEFVHFLVSYSLVLVVSTILYKFLCEGKILPSLNRRLILDFLCFDFLCVGVFNSLELNKITIFPQEWNVIFLFVYSTGGIVMSLCFGRNILKLLQIRKNSKKEEVLGDRCYFHDYNDIKCFSWFSDIYLPTEYRLRSDHEIKMIISHERTHIYYSHWIDLLIIQVFLIFQWFNPFMWYLKKELQQVHEYEVDNRLINEAILDKEDYQCLLLKENIVGSNPVIENFSSSALYKRFLMMNKNDLKKNWVTRGSFIFLATILILMFL